MKTWLVVAIVIGIIVIWFVSGYFIYYRWPTDPGKIGDMFGAINALFSGLAFAGIIYTIAIQRKEFAVQTDMLEVQRKQVDASIAELVEQNQTLNRQRFENIFFNLITVHENLVSLITANHINKLGQKETVAGRSAVDEYFGYIKKNVGKGFVETVDDYTSKLNNFELCYSNFIFILQYIHDQQFESKLSKEYLNIFFSQLSLGQIGLYIAFANFRFDRNITSGQHELALIKSFEVEEFLRRNDLIIKPSVIHVSAQLSAKFSVEIGKKSLKDFLEKQLSNGERLLVKNLLEKLVLDDIKINEEQLVGLLKQLEEEGHVRFIDESLIERIFAP